jgi:hypothetical protein
MTNFDKGGNVSGPGFEIVKRGSADVDRATISKLSPAPLAQAGLEPLKEFVGDDGHRGGILATVTAHACAVWVAVDPEADVPTVRVYCDNPSSPYAEAARNTQIRQHGNHLTVTVPEINPQRRTRREHDGNFYDGDVFDFRGGVFNSSFVGKVQNVVNTGDRVTMSGVSGPVTTTGEGVQVEILLPAESGIDATLEAASVDATGHLVAAKAHGNGGSFHAESIGRVTSTSPEVPSGWAPSPNRHAWPSPAGPSGSSPTRATI